MALKSELSGIGEAAPPGFLQRGYRMASDMLVYDLQFRLWCKGCYAGAGFRITIFDERTRGDSSKPRLERVVAAGKDGRGAAD